VRDGAAQYRGMQHAGQLDIVHVASAPLQQPQVFYALDGAADRRALLHGVCHGLQIGPRVARVNAVSIASRALAPAIVMGPYGLRGRQRPDSTSA
jgi:hypothetical protein